MVSSILKTKILRREITVTDKLSKLFDTTGIKFRETATNYNYGWYNALCCLSEFAKSGIEMKVFVSFHGGLCNPNEQCAQESKGELLVLHGGVDTVVTMDQFARPD